MRESAEKEWFNDARESYRDAYLRPLLRLLAEYLLTGEPAYADVYVDERLRFIGESDDICDLAAMLVADEHDLLAAVPDARTRPTLLAVLQGLHRAVLELSFRTSRGRYLPPSGEGAGGQGLVVW